MTHLNPSDHDDPELQPIVDAFGIWGQRRVKAEVSLERARELDVPHPQALFSGLVYATAGYTICWLLYPITSVFTLLAGLAAATLETWRRPSVPFFSSTNAPNCVVFTTLPV